MFNLSAADRALLRALPVGLTAFILTLVLAWPLRHGEPFWTTILTTTGTR